RPGAMLREVMFDTLKTVAIGTLPGVVVAIQAGHWLSSVVMVHAKRTATLTCVIAILVVAALAGVGRRGARHPTGPAHRLDRLPGRRRPRGRRRPGLAREPRGSDGRAAGI